MMNEDGADRIPEPTGAARRERLAIWPIFVGDEGLRSGWRLLLYTSAVILLVVLFTSLLGRLLGHRSQLESPWKALAGEVALLLSAIFPSVVAARLEHRHWGEYGLPSRKGAARRFVTGLLVGFVALSSLVLLIHLFHGFYIGSIALHGADLARYALLWALVFLTVGFAEEFLFRGYSLYTLTRGIGFWPAAISLSILFGALHLQNIGEDWIGAFGAGAIAVVFAFSLWRTGSLWFAVGLHAAWDWTESFFYGVSDSGHQSIGTLFHPRFAGSKWVNGGSVGPEGSVLSFVVVIAIALTIHLLYPKRQWQLE